MNRVLEREWLDHLPAHDRAAKGSRNDLRRLNALMGNTKILFSAIEPLLRRTTSTCRIAEVGAGDGTLMLKLARKLSPVLQRVEATLIDRVHVVEFTTLQEFDAIGWSVQIIESDLWDWIRHSGQGHVDIVIANLILHHFSNDEIRRLLDYFSTHSRIFIACEPRRSKLGIGAARLSGLVGCNRVTRHDAVVSVRAGFDNTELSQLWPNDPSWMLRETRAGWFSHLFTAKNTAL